MLAWPRALRKPGATFALTTLLLGCSAEPEATFLVPHHRLVDVAPPRGSEGAPPRLAIGLDSRTVLRTFPHGRIVNEVVTVPTDGLVELVVPVPAPLRGHEVLLLDARAKRPDVKEHYRSVQVAAARPRREGGRLVVDVVLGLRAGREPRPLALIVDAWAPLRRASQRIETPALDVPDGGVLEFDFGILEPARRQGEVRFAVLVCRKGECSEAFSETVDPRADGAAWRQGRVSLAHLAGSRRNFVFLTEQVGVPDRFSLPVWGNPTVFGSGRRPADAHNIVLLSLDTLRADHLQTYGYPRDTAPFLDGTLARRGSVFEMALSAASATAPSHMTLFTSLQPSVHDIRSNTGYRALPRSAVTLAETLRSHGFTTGAVTEGGGIAVGRGFERGFDTYRVNPVPLPHRPRLQSERTFPAALDWALRQRDERFFLFVHTYEVHGPRRPPDEYAQLFPTTPPGLEPDPRLKPKRHPVLYDREIRYLDDQLASFVQGLDEAGLLDRTLLVVTSDHGEEFYEHDVYGHGATVFEGALRVPLVFHGPGVASGRRVGTPVGLVDLMPTLLELAGVPAPSGLMGTSLAGLVRGRPVEPSLAARPVFSEAWLPYALTDQGKRTLEQPTYAVRLGSRKLIRYREGDGFRYEYYDLERDPTERHDLYATRRDDAEDLRLLVDRYAARTQRLRESLVRDEPARPGELDPERAEELRALGYLD